MGETEFDLSLPCSYDFHVAANRYLAALDEGQVPLLLLFSGTVFTGAPGTLEPGRRWRRAPNPRAGLPVTAWLDAIDAHFPPPLAAPPGHRSKARRGVPGPGPTSWPGWEDAIERLLKESGHD